VGVELYHADRQTDITKLTDAFRNFANVPTNVTKTTFIHEIKTTNVTKETLGVGHVYSNERMDAPMNGQPNLTDGLNPGPRPAKNNCIH